MTLTQIDQTTWRIADPAHAYPHEVRWFASRWICSCGHTSRTCRHEAAVIAQAGATDPRGAAVAAAADAALWAAVAALNEEDY